MILRLLTTLIALLVAASMTSLADSRSLALDLYLDMQDVSGAQIAPDGKRIVYSRRWVNKSTDQRESALWLMNADGSGNRPIGKGSSPRWSPDSTRIAYLAPVAQGEQLFVKRVDDDSSPVQITHLERTPRSVAWSADGTMLAFTILVPKKSQEWRLNLPGRPENAVWAAEPRVVERLVFRRDPIGFLEDGRVHIFVAPANAGTVRQLTQGDQDFGGGEDFDGSLSWTPDGREIVFSTLRPDDWEYPWRHSDVHAVDVTTHSIRRLTTREGPDYNPLVSPDGRWVAYSGYDWSNDSYISSKLYVVGIDGSNPREITRKFDTSLYWHPYMAPEKTYWWAGDSSGLYFYIGERGAMNLYFASRSGEVRQVTRGNHVLSISDINVRGIAVGTLGSFHKPNDIVIFDVYKPSSIRQLTAVNDDVLKDVRLGEVEEIWYRSNDGLKIQGWIVKPPNFDPRKKYPLILNIHGGPHAMYRVGFDFALQNHAAEGYVVLYTNPRGSTGYGAAFANAINNAFPGKDYDDLMKGVDEVIARGYVDERNLFVYGCSGGGELTAWIVGHTDRFAAASANCAVTNQLSVVGMTDGASFYWNYKKMFWEDPSEHLARSAIMHVGNVKTPTMLMTGELDLNTPIAQAEDFYRALKLRGVPTALVRFPDEYHGTYGVRPSNFLRTQLYLRHWFAKYSR